MIYEFVPLRIVGYDSRDASDCLSSLWTSMLGSTIPIVGLVDTLENTLDDPHSSRRGETNILEHSVRRSCCTRVSSKITSCSAKQPKNVD